MNILAHTQIVLCAFLPYYSLLADYQEPCVTVV